MVYEPTRGLPSDERFGLISQMTRAAVSIPPNLAEGQARHTTGEFIQFFAHAEGSLAELETQLRLSTGLGFYSEASASPLLACMDEERNMLNGLRRKLVTRH